MYHFCKVFQTVSLDFVKFSCVFQGWTRQKLYKSDFMYSKNFTKTKNRINIY